MSDSGEPLEPEFIIDEAGEGQRLDRFLASELPEFSRSRLQTLIEGGAALLNQKPVSASYKLRVGDHVIISIPPVEEYEPKPENIPLDILFEDDDIIVLNKPTGMVVHPSQGHWSGTLVNALLYHCGESLSGINGVKRPGIVHRLDKDTSGAMMVAKNDFAHQSLSNQLQSRALSRVYHAFCVGVPSPPVGSITEPVGRHPTNRLRMAVTHKYGREALTHYKVLENFFDEFAMLECVLSTGRTHQIRVHAESIKHCLLGDPVYAAQATQVNAGIKRAGYSGAAADFILHYPYQALHAYKISFVHPRRLDQLSFTAEYPDNFKALYTHLKAI